MSDGIALILRLAQLCRLRPVPGVVFVVLGCLPASAGFAPDWREHLNRALEVQRAGKPDQARVKFEAAVASARKLGVDSDALRMTLDCLSNFYDDIGDFGQAELVLNKSLSVWQRVLGPDNIALARVIQRLATIYIENGELARAISLDLPHWIARLQTEAPGSVELLDPIIAAATLKSASHHFAEAMELHRQALSLIRARGNDYAAESIELNDSGVVYLRAGDFDEAISRLAQSLELWTDSAIPRDTGTFATISQNLAEAFTKANRYSEAEKALERAMPVALKAYGAESPRMASLLLVRARLLRAERHNDEAKKVDKQIKTIMARYAKSDSSRFVVDVSSFVATAKVQ